ncbi:unnamed protein product [Brachionus calyciflorus]|uniref:Uncharacterized protein n=1 Tax=Brachionus calyciflorus TaxID=104777 RepID=A0A813ZVJ6_9BILA|nr:unnamed protein product [Brachionus calyciflorus]
MDCVINDTFFFLSEIINACVSNVKTGKNIHKVDLSNIDDVISQLKEIKISNPKEILNLIEVDNAFDSKLVSLLISLLDFANKNNKKESIKSAEIAIDILLTLMKNLTNDCVDEEIKFYFCKLLGNNHKFLNRLCDLFSDEFFQPLDTILEGKLILAIEIFTESMNCQNFIIDCSIEKLVVKIVDQINNYTEDITNYEKQETFLRTRANLFNYETSKHLRRIFRQISFDDYNKFLEGKFMNRASRNNNFLLGKIVIGHIDEAKLKNQISSDDLEISKAEFLIILKTLGNQETSFLDRLRIFNNFVRTLETDIFETIIKICDEAVIDLFSDEAVIEFKNLLDYFGLENVPITFSTMVIEN